MIPPQSWSTATTSRRSRSEPVLVEQTNPKICLTPLWYTSKNQEQYPKKFAEKYWSLAIYSVYPTGRVQSWPTLQVDPCLRDTLLYPTVSTLQVEYSPGLPYKSILAYVTLYSTLQCLPYRSSTVLAYPTSRSLPT